MDTLKRIMMALLALLMLLPFAACDDQDEPAVASVVIATRVTGDNVTVLATGDGDVALFIDGQPADNPCVIARGSVACTVTAYATVKSGDMPMAQSEVFSVEIPALATGPQPEMFSVNGVKFTMVAVDGGSFTMGTTDEEASDDEKPAHRVTLSDYSIGQTEVTQELWLAVMGTNPSHFSSRFYYSDNLQRPVEYVSWVTCLEFIAELNRFTGMAFRLPTEAEWEFAARGGNMGKGCLYAGGNAIDVVACYAASGTQAVASMAPNELGLYDMSGNVWEWCQDWKGDYAPDDQTNPTGPQAGTNRVTRGGSWSGTAASCRVSNRNSALPAARGENLGLRLAL